MSTAWPSLLVPSSEHWRLVNASRSGGVSITGAEQIVTAGAARWAATLTVPVNTDAKVLAARALLAGLDGRAGTVTVGPLNGRFVPWASDAYGRRLTPASVRRPQLDSTLYADQPTADLAETLVKATIAGDAALRGTSLTIAVAQGGALQPGQYFGVAGYLHLITSVIGTGSAGTAVNFRPGLRTAVAAKSIAELVAPTCAMRLASDDTGALDLQASRTGTMTLDLVEAF